MGHRGRSMEKGTAMQSRTPEAEPLLTPAEVASMFRVDPKTVTRWAKSGKLTSIRTLGGHRRYRDTSAARELTPDVDSPANPGRCPRRGASVAPRPADGPLRWVVGVSSVMWWRRAWRARAPRPSRRRLSLIHISEPTRRTPISYAVF